MGKPSPKQEMVLVPSGNFQMETTDVSSVMQNKDRSINQDWVFLSENSGLRGKVKEEKILALDSFTKKEGGDISCVWGLIMCRHYVVLGS